MRRVILGLAMVGVILLATACTAPPVATAAVSNTTAVPSSNPSTTIEPTPEPSQPTPGEPGATVVFHIVPEQSEARFLVDEVLAGSANTVVGTTSAVSGEITGSFAAPQSVTVGAVEVDLSTLRTDNSFRNRAIHDVILQTGRDANRFATFQLTGIEGLPAEAVLGTAYTLSLSGDLNIHGVTRPVTFAAVVTPVSEARLEGTATVSLPYGDFDIQILRLPPQVASVDDIVTLEIDFVAEAG